MTWSQSLGVEHKEIPLVSISRDQQSHSVGKPNFIANVYHGIPIDLYKFIEKPNTERPYLAFLGRISDSKLPDWAIQIAIKAGYHLKMAARFDKGDKYWEETIKPLIEKNKDIVEFVGEINDKQKNEFLGNALAFLFPINWPEPFGMVMIESMACGTPVIARRTGSVPEVIEDGISGILFDTIEQGVEAVNSAKEMDRSVVRKAFENRFTVSTMADNYLKVTLFATTDSITSAKLVAKWPAFNKSSAPMERYEWTYDQVRKNVTKFDILHFHTDEILEVIDDIVKENKTSCVVTIHTPIEF
ncbi:Glycos_transf_1 domain-containing protein [Meloidogyne graminicola]|uniref:Glycos_transf_1 domain-containing protein n=1 Tax=Meloidogyne graminicola TaxID=189291 RepID=A0A8S9ZF41_9BILA|nr:Glycos_transf_1 domain-containing protein [Meloidogyne graminicola]